MNTRAKAPSWNQRNSNGLCRQPRPGPPLQDSQHRSCTRVCEQRAGGFTAVSEPPEAPGTSLWKGVPVSPPPSPGSSSSTAPGVPQLFQESCGQPRTRTSLAARGSAPAFREQRGDSQRQRAGKRTAKTLGRLLRRGGTDRTGEPPPSASKTSSCSAATTAPARGIAQVSLDHRAPGRGDPGRTLFPSTPGQRWNQALREAAPMRDQQLRTRRGWGRLGALGRLGARTHVYCPTQLLRPQHARDWLSCAPRF